MIVSSYYVCCCRWHYLYVILFFILCCEMINILIFFLWCSFPTCVGDFLLEWSIILDCYRYCINLDLFWNILVSPSMPIEWFAGYSILDWHLWSFRLYMTSIQDALAFSVSIEYSGIILIGVPLYVTWHFPLIALVFFLCSMHLEFWNIMREFGFIFQSIWFSMGFLYIMAISFIVLGKFASMNLMRIF